MDTFSSIRPMQPPTRRDFRREFANMKTSARTFRICLWAAISAGMVSPAFSLNPSETLIHNFACYASDGAFPVSGLVFDSVGNLYGGTLQGGNGRCGNYYGTTFGCGTIYKLSLNSQGNWTETLLRQFQGVGDTAYVAASLIIDASGNLYGTTTGGSPYGDVTCSGYYAYGCGTVFKLSPGTGGWTETVLYTFTGGS